jgi:hypothetical protein
MTRSTRYVPVWTRGRWLERVCLGMSVLAVGVPIVELVRGRASHGVTQGALAVVMAVLFINFRWTRLRSEFTGYDAPIIGSNSEDTDPDTAAVLAGAEVEHGGDEQASAHRPQAHGPNLPSAEDADEMPRGQHGPTADYCNG